jgi:hypothetical protein
MKRPPMPRSEAATTSHLPVEAASNDGQFTTDAPASPATGWDPYDVWRSRVFAAQPAGYNKGRDNT